MTSQRLSLRQPRLPWRATSSFVMGVTGMLSRGFLYGLNTVEVTGLQRFLDILDKRKDPEKRERGLITVCNHISVMDDPLIWGVLPLRYLFNPSNMRWGLGAHDICFKNQALSTFFSLGQVLPTHRLLYSPHGGVFQPTIPEAIRLLSSQPFSTPKAQETTSPTASSASIPDPFTSGGLTYTTTGTDSHPAPSIYARNRHSWVHVFPEGCTHQDPRKSLRYFKWGLSRLILESEPMPDVLPMFIDGTHDMMSEDRGFPRFVPRAGAKLRVAFGELLDAERAFGDLRARWRELVRREEKMMSSSAQVVRGELSDELKYGKEAVELRVEVAVRVRSEMEKLRVSLGYPEDDPQLGLAETWAKEPAEKGFRSNVDGSLVKKE
ncbi:uncharacterized protein BCR38DRAFT_454809 [Pseudomassariella vexata]|uniref:Tafazzin family protein n=1 Tax=Pseudomassariella vexata TaxID=1141098 RepID=A0A1Y2EF60_9PEZI|nr:uncharacterized protein BCR38DRAFT_454809 [Pseudomassariella vexata]ORY69906.1 hypothetical protein BCR38DRAFT_454809 [Pseudomassariella vexata]